MEDELITFVVMLFNGLVTISFTPFLLRLYRRNRRNFYLLWGIGFLLYGLNIILRLFVTNPTDIEIEPLEWLVFLFYSFGFMNIITGVGDLIEKARLAFASSLILFLMPILVYYLPDLLIPAWMVTLSPYLIICVYLIFIRQRYRASVDLFLVGWVLLLLINISNPLGLIKPPYLDLLAIYGKIIIFFGMISTRFTYLADEIKQ